MIAVSVAGEPKTLTENFFLGLAGVVAILVLEVKRDFLKLVGDYYGQMSFGSQIILGFAVLIGLLLITLGQAIIDF